MSNAGALSRESRKAQTRRALIDAAGELFAKKGIEATSIDEIAAAVGLTKGAVYAHFRSKAELVEETLLAASSGVEASRYLEDSTDLAEFFTRVGREIAELAPNVPRRTILLYLEYLLYVLRDNSRQRAEARQQRKDNLRSGESFEQTAAQRGIDVPMPGSEMVALLNATGIGLALAFALDGRVVSADAVQRLFSAIGYGFQHHALFNESPSTRPST